MKGLLRKLETLLYLTLNPAYVVSVARRAGKNTVRKRK